jgi:hypothetical protein
MQPEGLQTLHSSGIPKCAETSRSNSFAGMQAGLTLKRISKQVELQADQTETDEAIFNF